MQTQGLTPIGLWEPDSISPTFSMQEISQIINKIREPVHIICKGPGTQLGLAWKGSVYPLKDGVKAAYYLMASLPALYPEWLGDRSFQEVHSLRFPYIAGAMFRGIASVSMVTAMAKAGMIGFFGAAGLSLDAVEKAVFEILSLTGNTGLSWGSNLIYSPLEPALEDALVDMYLKHGVQRISAAAFMRLSKSIVKYSSTGLKSDSAGQIHRKNYVFAKISRPETAALFMEPAPQNILDFLVDHGQLTKKEAQLALYVPVAEDITVEADSGGHTDNRPLSALFPVILGLRNKIMEKHNYSRLIRVGAAGGLGTPSAVASAFSMGAAYVLTGSINQSCMESGLSMEGKKMLAKAGVADVTMAPAADMFELGVKVQVLKRGTMFSNRAAMLYNIYSSCKSMDDIPFTVREKMEKDIFRAPLETIWENTVNYFTVKNPKELEKAYKNPKYKMSLIFRWYLGNSAGWAIEGDLERCIDYQICCGPSMGAFNSWTNGSFLEKPENREVANIALNLLEGAAVITRAQQLRSYGLPVLSRAFDFRPRHDTLSDLK